MKLFIIARPLNGSTSATNGMMMSVDAVSAFNVNNPSDGGQSINTYSNSPFTGSNSSDNILSLAIADASSRSAIDSCNDAGTKNRFSLNDTIGNCSFPVNAEYTVDSGSPFNMLLVRFAWASMSIISTRCPCDANIEPTLATVVVLPTPPLWLATEIIFVSIPIYIIYILFY